MYAYSYACERVNSLHICTSYKFSSALLYIPYICEIKCVYVCEVVLQDALAGKVSKELNFTAFIYKRHTQTCVTIKRQAFRVVAIMRSICWEVCLHYNPIPKELELMLTKVFTLQRSCILSSLKSKLGLIHLNLELAMKVTHPYHLSVREVSAWTLLVVLWFKVQ